MAKVQCSTEDICHMEEGKSSRLHVNEESRQETISISSCNLFY